MALHRKYLQSLGTRDPSGLSKAEPPELVASLSLHKFLWEPQDRWDDLIEEEDIDAPFIPPLS